MEPQRGRLRVTTMNSRDHVPGDSSLEALYAAAYPRLVRMLTAMSGSRADAEELVQEAFASLVPKWGRVSRYDQPEAWVRQVAVRSLISRRRRLKVALRARNALAQDATSPGPSGDRLDVDAAMHRLPVDHRAVLVLHHGLGLPLDEIARELGIPVGTVKSRLSRARAAFAAAYGEEAVR
jgi:RNA polymerase sigma-70 factor (ECF subfamily)